MRCPRCNCLDDKVVDSRSVKDGSTVRRRRECLSCSYRYSTFEQVLHPELRVIKRHNDEREDFNPAKIRRGIKNACYKRPITAEDIDKMVDEISAAVQRKFDREVPSTEIGIRTMEALKQKDQVAYVRFASVYRQFKDIEEFIDEIRSLGSSK